MTSQYPIAAGYDNFNQGIFAPEVFKQEALYYFRQLAIAEDITTSMDGSGITDILTTVHIRKQPQITVRPYVRGQNLQTQSIQEEELTLSIDQGNYYRFKLDDVMVGQSDVNYEELCGESAAYEVRDAYDTDILDFISDSAHADNTLGASSSEKTIGYGDANDYRPLDAISELVLQLDESNVPSTGRWFVAPPSFYNLLRREVGKLVEVQVTGDAKSLIRDKGVLDMGIHGFTMFQTNNAPTNANSKPVLMAGHVNAVATAQNFVKERVLPDANDFGNIFDGLHVFGRQVLRPHSLAIMHASLGDVNS